MHWIDRVLYCIVYNVFGTVWYDGIVWCAIRVTLTVRWHFGKVGWK